MWRIHSIELIGFKHLKLNNLKRFYMEMQSAMQLILGTNGCGKSSLLRELTPLPANTADYRKGGSKTIVIHSKNDVFTLKSTFGSKNVHSFKRNTEELNPGGTGSAQEILCLQFFNVTPESHAVMTGAITFSGMKAPERRSILTRLSDVSYDYALEMFAALKKRHNETSSQLKGIKRRLVEEGGKIVSDDEQIRLRRELDELHSGLTLLLENRPSVDANSDQLNSIYQNNMAELQQLSRRMFKLRFEAPYGQHPFKEDQRNEWGELIRPVFNNLDEVDDVLLEYNRAIASMETVMRHTTEEHQKLEETLKLLGQRGADGIDTLRNKLNTIVNRSHELHSSRILRINGLDASKALPALHSVRETLMHVFDSIPLNDDGQFTAVGRKELDQELFQLKDRLEYAKRKFNEYSAKRDHLESHKGNKQTDCPKCGHVWIAGFSEQDLVAVTKALEGLSEEIKAMEVVVKDKEEKIAAYVDYSSIYRDYSNCVRNVPALEEFWKFLSTEQCITHKPREGMVFMERLEHDLNLELEIEQLSKEAEQIKTMISASVQAGDADMADVKAKMDDCQQRLGNATAEYNRLTRKMQEFQFFRKQRLEAMNLEMKIAEQMEKVKSITSDRVRALRRETMDHCVRQIQSHIAAKEEILSTINQQNAVYRDLQQQEIILSSEEKAAGLLVKELSPNEGLIAEGLMGFINTFVRQMNAVIESIWSYPLEIKTCNFGGEDFSLDYLFPFIVQDNEDEPSKDVSVGSRGQREVFDLAFKKVYMHYTGLSDSPFMLDEFGSGFDVQHRISATNAILAMAEHQLFPQLFIVSHYDASYGALAEAEVCVLCSNNVATPSSLNYNKRIEIE